MKVWFQNRRTKFKRTHTEDNNNDPNQCREVDPQPSESDANSTTPRSTVEEVGLSDSRLGSTIETSDDIDCFKDDRIGRDRLFDSSNHVPLGECRTLNNFATENKTGDSFESSLNENEFCITEDVPANFGPVETDTDGTHHFKQYPHQLNELKRKRGVSDVTQFSNQSGLSCF